MALPLDRHVAGVLFEQDECSPQRPQERGDGAQERERSGRVRILNICNIDQAEWYSYVA